MRKLVKLIWMLLYYAFSFAFLSIMVCITIALFVYGVIGGLISSYLTFVIASMLWKHKPVLSSSLKQDWDGDYIPHLQNVEDFTSRKSEKLGIIDGMAEEETVSEERVSNIYNPVLKNTSDEGMKENENKGAIIPVSAIKPHREPYVIKFLTKDDINGIVISDISSLKDPAEEYGFSPWFGSLYVYSKMDINSFTSEISKKTYKSIRKSFLSGEYYNLSGRYYSSYAFVLMFDLLDSVFLSSLSNEDVIAVFLRLAYVCPSTLPYVADRVKNKMQNGEIGFSYWRNFALTLNDKVSSLPNMQDIVRKDYLDTLWILSEMSTLTDAEQLDVFKASYLRKNEYSRYPHLCRAVVKLFLQYRKITGNNPTWSRLDLWNLSSYCNIKLINLAIKSIYPPYQAIEDDYVENKLICGATIDPEFFKGLISDKVVMEVNNMRKWVWKKQIEYIKEQYTINADKQTLCKSLDRFVSLNCLDSLLWRECNAAVKLLLGVDAVRARRYYFLMCVVNPESKMTRKDLKALFKDFNQTAFDEQVEMFRAQVNPNDVKRRICETYSIEWILVAIDSAIAQITTSRRRKISIDTDKLSEMESQFKETVGVLDSILEDEEAVEECETAVKEEWEEEPLKKEQPCNGGLVDFFISHSFSLSREQIDEYARQMNSTAAVMVNDINERYFEELDDNLIEEDGERFFIREENLKLIDIHGRN